MARLSGLGCLVFTTGMVFLLLRGLHLATPVVFPETRQGPIAIARLEDVRGQTGFAPILPAYRPDTLGDRPGRTTVWLSPVPTIQTTWVGPAHHLTVVHRRGGTPPPVPPLARSLDDLPDTAWWTEDGRTHLRMRRGEDWLELDTSLPVRELRRFVDTLTMY